MNIIHNFICEIENEHKSMPTDFLLKIDDSTIKKIEKTILGYRFEVEYRYMLNDSLVIQIEATKTVFLGLYYKTFGKILMVNAGGSFESYDFYTKLESFKEIRARKNWLR